MASQVKNRVIIVTGASRGIPVFPCVSRIQLTFYQVSASQLLDIY